MNYKETLNYLFNSVPMFQKVGSKAYKEGLENTYLLDEHFGKPHLSFKTIHIGGTNGKGSCSNTLAAILQSAGYKVGLFTSPHLIDFRERIRVNGTPVEEEFVIDFVASHKEFFEPLSPSFFELTTAMAFHYFKLQKVDVAIIEVGLGGRLDCTNIIHPELSIITNISLDHTQLLGDTLSKIAIEKAGIIKHNSPVIIGESVPETRHVFSAKASEMGAPILFAEEEQYLSQATLNKEGYWEYSSSFFNLNFKGELCGWVQKRNANTVLSALHQLRLKDFKIADKDIINGFANISKLTGLMGRWQKLSSSPKIVCDVAHNVAGVSYVVEQLQFQEYNQLHIVFGMVNDKDISHVLDLLPKDATYYFTQASVSRALPADDLKSLALDKGLKGECYPTVELAVKEAQKKATQQDFIYVGGSCFIVADLLSSSDTFDFN